MIVYRNPVAVARSLERRNGIALGHGVALWAHYTASALVNTIRRPRILAAYEELFTAGRPVVSKLARFLGVPDPDSDPHLHAEMDRTVDQQLRHHAASPAELTAHPAVSWYARELFELLEADDDRPDRGRRPWTLWPRRSSSVAHHAHHARHAHHSRPAR